jgi:HEAT repeat protein
MLAEMATASGNGELGPIVLRLLLDETAEVRVAAARAAGRMKSRAAVPALCRLVQRESRFFSGGSVREAAVRALGDIGSPECLPVLQGLLNAGPWRRLLTGARLREAAAEALGKIAGQTSERAARDHHRVVTMASTDTPDDFGRESAYGR